MMAILTCRCHSRESLVRVNNFTPDGPAVNDLPPSRRSLHLPRGDRRGWRVIRRAVCPSPAL